MTDLILLILFILSFSPFLSSSAVGFSFTEPTFFACGESRAIKLFTCLTVTSPGESFHLTSASTFLSSSFMPFTEFFILPRSEPSPVVSVEPSNPPCSANRRYCCD